MTSTFQTALTTPNYTSLRGSNGNNSWWAKQFITLCKNTTIFAARVNGAISSNSFAQITFDTVTTGAYTDIEVGETFFISHTSNIRDAYYRGRIRKVATSTLLKVNETSVNITDNDYLFVVYDFDIWDKLSRMVGSTQYQDWDVAFHPLAPVAVGLQTAYVNYDATDAAYRIAFNVSNSYPTDNDSSLTLTYQFTFVAGTYTVVSGALNTAVVTVDINANTEQWAKLVITDSQGTTTTRRFYIRAHGSTDTPALDFSGAQITGSIEDGWNATVSAWSGVSSVLNQTFVVIWSQEYYNGTLGAIYNNIDMVGRFHREENQGRGDPVYSYVTDVKFDIEGIHTQMARLQEQDLTTIVKGHAAAWDEISFNNPQRSIAYYLAEHSTVLSLCDLTFPAGIDNTYLFMYVPNQGGNVLDAIKGIAAQINAYVEFAPDGRIQVVRDTCFLSDASGVVVVGNFDNRDFTAIESLSVDPVQKTGRLDAYGNSYNAGVVTVVRSRAPGVAQGYAAGQSQLDNQCLAASSDQNAIQTELNFRAGQQLAIENMTYTQTWKAAHGGYHFLIPSRAQRVTHLYTTSTNARGLAFTTSDYWQVVSISISHDNATGAREVSTVEELEPPLGDPGDTVPAIAPGTIDNPITLQPLDPFPALPDDPANYLPDDPTPSPYPPLIPPKTGDTVIYTDGSNDWTSRSVISYAVPVWTGTTPIDLGSYVIKAVCFDLTTTAPPIGAYLLASDGTNSAVWYTADAFARPANWVMGASFVGVYTQMRSAGTAGSVIVEGAATPGTPVVVDFTSSNGSFAAVVPATPRAVYVGGTGWTRVYNIAGLGISETRIANSSIVGAFSSIAITFTCTGPISIAINDGDVNSISSTITSSSFGAGAGQVYTYSTPFSLSTGLRIDANNVSGNITITITNITYTPADTVKVRVSTDYGATVGSAVTVGATPGALGAIDITRLGGATIAAAAGQVKIATTLGGSYSNAAGGTLSSGNPVSLVIPYRRLPHGATQYSATDPDYIVGGSAIISSSCLWDVDGTTGTKTSINPVAGATCVGPNLLTVWQSSTTRKIAVVVSVGGVKKVYVWNGTVWVFSKTVTNPIFLRCRRGDPNGTQLYLLDGSTLYVSRDWGVTWLSRTLPSSNTAVFMDIYS